MLDRLTNHINVADTGGFCAFSNDLMRLSFVQTSQMSRLMLFLCLFCFRVILFHFVCIAFCDSITEVMFVQRKKAQTHIHIHIKRNTKAKTTQIKWMNCSKIHR